MNTTIPPYTYGNVTISPSPSMVYTATGTNGSSWTTIDPAATLQQSGTLELRGKNADLKINGVSLSETLEGIQEMLGLMRMDPALEQEFEELQQVGRQYRELHRKFQDQKRVWETLKTQDL